MLSIKNELLEFLRRGDTLRAILCLGRIRDPKYSMGPHLDKILEIAARVWHRNTATKHDPVLKAEAINTVLFKELGFMSKKSEGYKQVIDDPERVFLQDLLDKNLGSPLSVTVLYLMVAEQVGLEVQCIALPNYFFLKVFDSAIHFYIDPFDGGKLLSSEEFQKKLRSSFQKSKLLSQSLYEELKGMDLVARVVQQLKHVYILKGRALEALRAVEILTGIFPGSPELARDRGILYCEMEYFSKAAEDLKHYLRQRPHADDVKEIRKLADMLQGYREIMN